MTPEQAKTRLKGAIAALPTPFRNTPCIRCSG